MIFKNSKLMQIAKKYQLQLIVLFGSAVKEKMGPMSDIDIAVLADEFSNVNSTDYQLSLQLDLQMALNKQTAEVDMVVLNDAAPLMKYQVAMEGKPLFEKEEDLFLEFAIKTMKEYEDVRHFYKYDDEIIEDYLRKVNDK